jgi:hypothetical protein
VPFRVGSVESVKHGKLESNTQAAQISPSSDHIVFTMPLDAADIVMIRPLSWKTTDGQGGP